MSLRKQRASHADLLPAWPSEATVGSGLLIVSVEGTTLPVRRGWSPFASFSSGLTSLLIEVKYSDITG